MAGTVETDSLANLAPDARPQNNFARMNVPGESDPLVSSDLEAGYSEGSLWYAQGSGKLYICTDSTKSAAVWKEVVTREANAIVPLQQFLTDADGIFADTTDAYSYTVPANTLTANGESIKAVYAGTVNASAIVTVEVMFAGTSLFWSDEISIIDSWRLDVDIIRTSATTARCSVGWIYRQDGFTKYTAISSGLDFTTGEVLKLRLYSEDAGSNITAKVGKIWKQGAA